MKICSICGGNYEGYGNNAFPINLGRCCDQCNNVVISHRIRNVQRGACAYDVPPWLEELQEKILDDPSLKSEGTALKSEGPAET